MPDPQIPNPGTPSVDWQQVHERLARARSLVDQEGRPDPGGQQRILRSRAQTLAREPEAEPGVDSFLDVVEFRLGPEAYALESGCISAVHRLEDLTPLPCTPAFVVGIVNVRGRIVSVIDLRHFFDVPAQDLTDLSRAIIIRSDTLQFGILADTVVGTRRVPLDELQSSLSTFAGVRRDYLRGVTGDRTVILDARRLLADRSLVVYQEVSAE